MIRYFGTPFDEKGHSMWKCDGEYLERNDVSYFDFYKNEFCPESIADEKRNKQRGDVFWFRIGKWTICYIEGSCSDNRSGSKSVFFTDEKMTFGELAIKIMNTPVARKIIKQMPFEVKWNLREDILEQMHISK